MEKKLLKERLKPILRLVLAGMIGASAMFFVLYKKPGKHKLEKFLAVAGVRERMAARYSRDYSAKVEVSGWQGVRSPAHGMWKVRPGLDVRKVADGFTYPSQYRVRLAAADGSR